MVDVFEQVEEELRSDRYKRLARTWLPVVGGVLLVALIAALSFWGWDSWQTSKADKASIAYDRGLESLEADNLVGADTAFIQVIKEGNGAYKSLALNERAGIALAGNRVPEAIAFLDEAAKASRDPMLSDLAALKAVWLAMDIETLEQIEARLAPLVKDGRPFSAFALEAQALTWLQHGKTAEAREALVLLKNGLDTPEIVTQRADLTIAAIDSGGGAPTGPGGAAATGPSNLAAIVRAQGAIPVASPAPTVAPVAPAAPVRP
ncbi:MAG: tetratricopeptide repeat protein [Rhodoferax sp.]|uniref:tetratricopeptide repeat protein n=1 Tax=Rhodoferax sp. TaxID=50421 RepID=UPI0027317DAB|nr:tetratricopeptide repeat protein [Rhodoferax sp.]MDP1528525.1 tetratricopeptide repeat protein [Rhodoferax sp.]